MSLEIDIRHRLGNFKLEAAFTSPGGLTALFGRSGAGKTTIVNAVAGLMRPMAGRIVIDGRTLFDSETGAWTPAHKRNVGYVFQDSRLFPHMTVRQNLLYGRWGRSRRAETPSLQSVAEMLDIGPLLRRRPGGLSGGERQRVAIGRALLACPTLLLMDEPLASLDDARKAEIMPYLERLRDDAGIPILYVSHSVAEIARLAATVVVLEEGRVKADGPADAILADPEAATAFGHREAGAVLTAEVVRHHADGLSELKIDAGPIFLPRTPAQPGARLRVRIHANDVIIARTRPEGLSALNIAPATVVSIRTGAGPGAIVQLAAGRDRFLARITQRSVEALCLAPGEACFAVLKSVAVAQGDVGPASNEVATTTTENRNE